MKPSQPLKKYRATQVVHACPMSSKEYEEKQGLPKNERPDSAGMFIIDDMESEDEHDSWMPLNRFRQIDKELKD